jgi:peptidoglycan/xylan/chitin deacetylase (PgdA/CDA1 family)
MILSHGRTTGISFYKLIIAAVFAVLLPSAVFAKLSFSGLDLSNDNRLLFLADMDMGGGRTQSALMLSRLTAPSLRQLTAFPEKIEVVENGRSLQVRNAFGTLRLPLTGGLPRSIAGFPAFTDGAPVLGGRLDGMAASGDGRWLLLVDPVTAAYGNLILVDTRTGARTVIANNIERPETAFPARWSPDSRVFVYTKGGKLYYHSLGVNTPAAYPVDERYRLIGDGNTNSMYWSNIGDFFYLKGSTVYRVRGPDLFTRSIYADFLEIGAVAGKIPFEFDPEFDAFWIAPDFRSMLLSKGGRNIFYFPLGLDDYNSDRVVSLPYLMLPRSTVDISVLWSSGGIITVLAAVPPGMDGKTAIAYRLDTEADDSGEGMTFKLLESPPGPSGALSGDGIKVVFWGEGGCILYDYANWKRLQIISNRPVWDCLWLADGNLVMGDNSRLERIKITLNGNGAALSRSLVCLSSANIYGYEEETGRIVANAGGMWFVTDGANPWTEVVRPVLRTPSQVSGRYRVYLEKQNSGPYENIPMIRNTAASGTSSLVRIAAYAGAGKAAGAHPPADGGGIQEVAVCFDLYDDATGLPHVLGILRRYGIKATFFINGEFIRRFPGAVRDIIDDGHETASMFFVPIDLSDSRYQINVDFISQGLARNEDEFYDATGRELALLWHPPYFALSSEFAEAAAKSGYKTIGRDVDPMDWVTRAAAAGRALVQYSASEMIDRIMDAKKPGSVIPIRLGLLPGGRQDYLYNRLGVLFDALIRGGYGVVSVSTLIDHAKAE